MDWILPFKALFIGIFLEAVPFILIGVIVSSIIHVYLPEKWIKDHIPKHPVLGILYAISFGFIFPICECGIIPVIKRLIQKGMPTYMGVVIIAVGPIFNPVVLLATFTAFEAKIEVLYLRILLALFIGILLGLIFYLFFNKQNYIRSSSSRFTLIQPQILASKPSLLDRIREIASHSISEFIDMGTYLIIGSLITAIIQLGMPREWIEYFGYGHLSHFFMMGLAYVMSLCSTSDAFVGLSLWNYVNPKAIVTFLVIGPMIDFKGTLMLLSSFKATFVLIYIFTLTILISIIALLMEWFVTLN